MGFARTAVGVLFISVLVFYLSTVGQLTDEAKWGFVGAMAVLAFLWGVPSYDFIYPGILLLTLEESQMPPDTQPTCE